MGGAGWGELWKKVTENDAFTWWRRVLTWQAGELAKIKRRHHKRVRRDGKEQIRKEMKS